MSEHERLGHADGCQKLLTVFNASQRTTSGVALNRLLYTGSKLPNILTNSLLSYDQRHPAISRGDSPLAGLIIDLAHRAALHGGFQFIYSYAVRSAWNISERVRVKAYIRSCFHARRTLDYRSLSSSWAIFPSKGSW